MSWKREMLWNRDPAVFVTAGCGFHDGDVLLGYLAGRFHETVKEGAVVVARLVFGIVSSTHVKGCW